MATRKKDETIPGPEMDVAVADDGWQELAGYDVSFGLVSGPGEEQHLHTRVHHAPTGQQGQWAGLASGQLVAWMLQQLGPALEAAGRPLGTLPALLPPGDEPALLEISGLWVSEMSIQPGRMRAEVCVGLVDELMPDLGNNRIPFVVEFHLVNTATGHTEPVACRPGTLNSEGPNCGIETDWPIPPAGRYELRVMARMLPPWQGSAQLPGPVIVVEP